MKRFTGTKTLAKTSYFWEVIGYDQKKIFIDICLPLFKYDFLHIFISLDIYIEAMLKYYIWVNHEDFRFSQNP